MTRQNTFAALLLAAALAAALPAFAQAPDAVPGQVTKVDASAGKITIKHGPLKRFDMEDGMTMVFRAGRPCNAQERQGRGQSDVRARAYQRPVHRDQDRESKVGVDLKSFVMSVASATGGPPGDQHAAPYRMVMPKHICPFGLKAKNLLEREGFVSMTII